MPPRPARRQSTVSYAADEGDSDASEPVGGLRRKAQHDSDDESFGGEDKEEEEEEEEEEAPEDEQVEEEIASEAAASEDEEDVPPEEVRTAPPDASLFPFVVKGYSNRISDTFTVHSDRAACRQQEARVE